MFSWGRNDCGQAFRGSKDDQSHPVAIESLNSFVQVACGSTFNIGLTSHNHLYSWGHSLLGALGLGHVTEQLVPERITRHLDESLIFKQICAGEEHVLALTREGHVYVWGSNDQGQLGTSNYVPQMWPRMQSDFKFTMVAAGSKHSAGISEDGSSVYVWGAGWAGQNAQTDLKRTCVPKRVLFKEGMFKLIFAGGDCTFAVTKVSKVYSWGSGAHGKLGHGNSEDVLVPKFIKSLNEQFINPIKICCRGDHVLLLTSRNEVYSWGSSSFNEIAQNRLTRQLITSRIQFQENFTDICSGQNFSILVDERGDCYGFGSSKYGVLGNNKCDESIVVHAKINLDFRVQSLFSSEHHVIALKSIDEKSTQF